ncbi:MAG: PRC-barrel domain-containing protein [Betaproteobacteria bacterium]
MVRRNPPLAAGSQMLHGLFGRPVGWAAARGSSGPGGRLVRAAGLVGEPVVSRDGVPLGNVSELLLDVQRGRIAYAVVTHGGFMGLGERLQAVPWCALSLDDGAPRLVLDADRATFLGAPAFDNEHWPGTPGPDWHQALHRHYRCAPYWE